MKIVIAILVLLAGTAHADGPAFVHVVLPGETLASIAQRYYGDARRESVLVAENGLTTQGGAAIVVGLRLVIPVVSYHRVQPGQTWAQIATQHYGDPRRVSALIEANPQVQSAQPDVGAELLVPYPLRHVCRQNDTIRRVAGLYYGDEGEAARLMRFNAIRGRGRLSRGQIVLVPLPTLLLSEEGRHVIAEAPGQRPEAGEVRNLQAEINDQLPPLREHVQRGRYAEAVALGNHLLGGGQLTGNQLVTIQRELAVAYVALDRTDLAIDSFYVALGQQPDFEIDTQRTSPRVLDALRQARERFAQRPPQVSTDAGVPDAASP
jgi:LysM repeat protein